MGYDMTVRGAARDAERAYLRRNIFGMHPTVEAMVGLGMAFWSPSPEFPKAPTPYEDHVRYDEQTGEDVPVTAEGQIYLERVASTLSTHGETRTPGIPSHKVCTTNDGWHVTREECEQALAAYDKAISEGAAHPEYFRDDVIPFLRYAAECDGFEVF